MAMSCEDDVLDLLECVPDCPSPHHKWSAPVFGSKLRSGSDDAQGHLSRAEHSAQILAPFVENWRDRQQVWLRGQK
jgi:hypothetical protein